MEKDFIEEFIPSKDTRAYLHSIPHDFRHDLPWVLEKRTQNMIEKESQRSLEIIKKTGRRKCLN